MKKSTLLYIGLHAMIMLLPILFIAALNIKIATGDVIDVDARRAAFYKNVSLPDFNEIEVVSSDFRNNLEVEIEVLDTVNSMRIDTLTMKCLTYSVTDGRLRIDYNFKKDSLSNPDDRGKYEYDYVDYADHQAYRSIKLYVKSAVEKIILTHSDASLALDKHKELNNNLDVTCTHSKFTLKGPYYTKDQIIERKEDFVLPYFYEYGLSLHLFDHSQMTFTNIVHVKKLDVELRGESTLNRFMEAGEFNLTVDEQTHYNIDVHDIHKVKIKYVK